MAIHDTEAPHRLFDPLARFYDLFPVPTHPRVIRRALRGARGPLLDLGGGTAKYTVRYANGALRPIVADPSRPMMQRARRKHRPVRLAQAVGATLPFRAGSIGAITITEAFHHFVPDQDAVLAECARVLQPHGLVLIEEPDPTRLAGRFMTTGEQLGQMGSVFHSPDELAERARRHFLDVSTRRSGWSTYLLTARAPQPL